MGPKAKGGGGKKNTGGKKTKIIDWSADENFDPNRVMIYIEHTDECPIFKDKANEFQMYLQERFPEKIIQLIRNGKEAAREGTFEITVAQNARSTPELVWSGIKNGPPRRDKFPISWEEIFPKVSTIINKVVVEVAQINFDIPEEEDEDKDDMDMPLGGAENQDTTV